MTVAMLQKRTNVRAAVRLRALRLAFRALEPVAPARAGSWALGLWATLPAGRGRARDLRPRPGQRSEVRSPEGHTIAVESWGEGAPIYLLHGWGGWRGQMGAFVDPLTTAGHRVLAIDVPGHGDAGPGAMGPGKGAATEFVSALQQVVAEHGHARAVIGHSLGAAMSARAIADGLPVDRLALVAPAPDPIGQLTDFARMLAVGPRSMRTMTTWLETFAGRPMSDFALAASLDRMPPTLLVHDRRDKEVPFSAVERMAKQRPGVELEVTDGLGHQRILADPDVIATVVRYVTG